MIHSEPWDTTNITDPNKEKWENKELNRFQANWDKIKELLDSSENDAQLVFWGPEDDIATALDTITERCQLAFKAVPNETRKSFPDGTTIFERVLPGPDRMYPDTDSKPLPIQENRIQTIKKNLPRDVSSNVRQMQEWKIPGNSYTFILVRNLFPLIERVIHDFNQPPAFVGALIGQHLKHIEGQIDPTDQFDYQRIYQLFDFSIRKKLKRDILKEMLPTVYQYPKMDFESILTTIGYRQATEEEILENIPVLVEKFMEISKLKEKPAMIRWVMGRLRSMALGNMNLKELREKVETAAETVTQNEPAGGK